MGMPILLALLAVMEVAAGETWMIPGVGHVNGTVSGNVKVFYGIKYGQARRFEQAVSAEPWVGRVRDATVAAPPCVQHYDGKWSSALDLAQC